MRLQSESDPPAPLTSFAFCDGRLEVKHMPLDKPPPWETGFGSPLELSRVHWVQPEVVVEVTYLTWTEGGLLRAVSYQGQREGKPARQVVRSTPHRLD